MSGTKKADSWTRKTFIPDKEGKVQTPGGSLIGSKPPESKKKRNKKDVNSRTKKRETGEVLLPTLKKKKEHGRGGGIKRGPSTFLGTRSGEGKKRKFRYSRGPSKKKKRGKREIDLDPRAGHYREKFAKKTLTGRPQNAKGCLGEKSRHREVTGKKKIAAKC